MPPTAARIRPEPTAALRWTAVFSVLAISLLAVLAASAQLHGIAHGGADHVDHTCTVTLFNQGMELASDGTGVVSTPVLFPVGPCSVQPALPVAGAENLLPPERGPPHC